MKLCTQKFIEDKIVEIKKTVDNKRAVVAISGGVDSTTCAVLADRALSNNLVSIFLDSGLMRERDEKEVLAVGEKIGIPVKVVRVAEKFFTALKGKVDPEEKRKAFRECFYQTLAQLVKKERANFLIQGTIAADIKETKGGIKTQHNVLEQIGIDPKKYGFSVIEPLRDLYKPEVRKIARVLGLPKEVFTRQPFPGPGLAARIIGEVTPKRTRIERLASEIIEEELVNLKPFQCFAVLLSDRATGMVGGKRLLGKIVAIRSVESEDALIATATKVPWRVLEKICQRITKEIPGVIKVLYDLTPKPPSTIEYI
ncbi:ExsB family transcriptional regulator [Candidatus Microgenomates bacterium]|nr:ExsB family transcriptional regulator [Candidatus Microgenomates bacterium]